MRFCDYISEATTGIAAWKKHFSGKTVKTTVKETSRIFGIDGEPTSEYINVGETIDVLDIEPTKGKGGLLATIKYKSSTVKINFNNITKPIVKGATEKLRINATNMTHGAKTEEVHLIHKKFNAKVFTSAKELATIIQNNINNNKNIPEHLKEILTDYLQQSSYKKIKWTDEVEDFEKNELGKYLGELIIGLMCLNGELSVGNALEPKDVDSFLVPDDPSFSGVDSLFIRKKDGTVVAISSKFGAGAKASFFSNMMPIAVENEKALKSPIMKALVNIVNRYNLNPERQGKDILYRFGFEHVLNVRGIDGRNAMDIFHAIRKGDMNDDVQNVMKEINSKSWKLEGDDGAIKKQLPMSLTSFFSRSLSYMLNNDRQALDDMITILGAKDYWQANLNISSWKSGEISFSFRRSGNAKLTIIGSKAAIGDITGSQGMVNYLLQ